MRFFSHKNYQHVIMLYVLHKSIYLSELCVCLCIHGNTYEKPVNYSVSVMCRRRSSSSSLIQYKHGTEMPNGYDVRITANGVHDKINVTH